MEIDRPIGKYAGKDIDLKQIEGEFFYFSDSTFVSEIIDGKIVDKSFRSYKYPYAFITVEGHGFEQLVFEIYNPGDFRNLWRLRADGYLDKDQYQVLVKKIVKKGIKKWLGDAYPHFEFRVYSKSSDIRWLDCPVLYTFGRTWSNDSKDLF
ncbi:MAG: hypothetical protein ABIP78_02950 [Pyrinomonadaceae bacterium]